jgi:hypothetical protein
MDKNCGVARTYATGSSPFEELATDSGVVSKREEREAIGSMLA